MTDLQRLYSQLRSRGLSHGAALRSMAESVGVDDDCIKRQLERARTVEAQPPPQPAARTTSPQPKGGTTTVRASGRSIVSSFAIPPGAPPEILEAQAHFDEIATRYAERQGEISDAQATVEAGKAKDHEEAVEATLAGEELSADLSKHEGAAASKVEALRATLPALAEVTDKAGNALAAAIDEHRAGWRPQLDAAREAAADRYDEALAEAREAAEALATARGAADWLSRFDVGRARAGQVVGFLGRGPRLIAEDKTGRQSDAAELLALAARVTAPPPPTPEERQAARRAKRERSLA